MKLRIPLLLGTLAGLTGCASHPNPIAFSDEPEVQMARGSNAAPAPAAAHLAKADQLKIEQLVFGALLERHFWDRDDYSAVFLQAEDAEVQALMQAYPNHVPPIKPSSHAQVQPHRAPLDKDSNRPAMILSADVNEPNADHSVDAIGRWYAGDAVAGFRTFHLSPAGDTWQIAETK